MIDLEMHVIGKERVGRFGRQTKRDMGCYCVIGDGGEMRLRVYAESV